MNLQRMAQAVIAALAAVTLILVGAPSSSAATNPFAPSSIWNAPLPTNPPVDQNNGWLQFGLSLQNHDGSFWSAYGPNIYRVTNSAASVPVVCTQYCTNVPATFKIPAGGVVPPSSSDAWVGIINTDTGVELDLWQASWDGTTLRGNGGTSVSTSGSGWCGPVGTHCYSATASGSALTAGLITPDDLRSGVIAHSLSFVPRTVRAGYIACPATHADGAGWLWDPPEGSRLFLPRSYVIPAGWPAVAKLIAKAMQDYGAVVVDQGSWTFRYESNADWSGTDLANNTPVHYPADFPWGQLNVMPITQC